MKIVVTSNGSTLEARPSPVFGRCPIFLFIDTDTMEFEAVENPATGAPGGAGIQAAQLIADRGAEAVISGNFGPNAYHTLAAAGIDLYTVQGNTARDAVENFKAGRLSRVAAPTGRAGRGRGRFRRGG
jgi:predicted Fe-Mo cluster-binding NifX family protein